MRIFAQASPLRAEISNIAADKSISHRAAIFSLLAEGTSKISNYLEAEDTQNTLKIVELLGASVQHVGGEILITPPEAIKEPNVPLGLFGGTRGLFRAVRRSVSKRAPNEARCGSALQGGR